MVSNQHLDTILRARKRLFANKIYSHKNIVEKLDDDKNSCLEY